MDLKAIEALLAVSTTGTVAAAARQLDISRSSVRRRLDALEADVGVILMHRGDTGARLTPAGRLLASRGEAIVRSAREAAQDARTAAKKPEGLVRIVSPLGAPPDMRARLFLALAQMHPGLRFEVVDAHDPLDYLDDEFDLLVYFGAPLEGGAHFIRSIAKIGLGLMASPAYLDRHETPRTIEDLAHHRLLLWRPSRGTSETVPGLEAAPTLVSANMELIREMAAQGGGIAWCGVAPFGQADQGRALVPVLAESVSATITGWLVCPLPSTLDPRVRALLEGLINVLEPIDLR